MKKVFSALVATLVLSACANLTPTENLVMGLVIGGVLVESTQPRNVIYTNRYYHTYNPPVHIHRPYHSRGNRR